MLFTIWIIYENNFLESRDDGFVTVFSYVEITAKSPVVNGIWWELQVVHWADMSVVENYVCLFIVSVSHLSIPIVFWIFVIATKVTSVPRIQLYNWFGDWITK